MRILVGLGVAAAAAALVPAALASTSISQPTRLATVTACSALRSSVGVVTFQRQYASLSACASQWKAVAGAVRTDALRACTTKGLGSACVARQMAATMLNRLYATAPQMQHCSAQVNLLGVGGFLARYGGSTLGAAFGSCVAPKSIQAVVGAPAPQTSYPLTFSASPLNGSGVNAFGSVQVNADGLILSSALFGAEAGQPHGVLFLASGSCSSVDAGGAVVLGPGSVLAMLDPAHQSGSPFTVVLPETLGPALAGRTVVVLGKTVGGVYDRAYPVACGTLSSS